MKKKSGFTLIEVMVTVGVIAILAAIAAPAYLSQQRKGNRAGVINALAQISIEMNRCYSDTGGYTCCTDAIILPRVLDITDNNDNAAPGYDTDSGHYNITITWPDPPVAGLLACKIDQTFLITATVNPGTDQVNDVACPSFSIDSQGNQTSGAGNASCWARQN